MTDVPPDAPPRAPFSIPSELVSAAKELVVSLALSAALITMIFVAVPTANHDPVIIVISGFLGFLTGRNSRTPVATPTPPAA